MYLASGEKNPRVILVLFEKKMELIPNSTKSWAYFSKYTQLDNTKVEYLIKYSTWVEQANR